MSTLVKILSKKKKKFSTVVTKYWKAYPFDVSLPNATSQAIETAKIPGEESVHRYIQSNSRSILPLLTLFMLGNSETLGDCG